MTGHNNTPATGRGAADLTRGSIVSANPAPGEEAWRQRRVLVDPTSGVYVCTACGRQWDAIWFRTTSCTCGIEGEPWQPPPDPPWLALVRLGPNPHPRDLLLAYRDARRTYEAAQRRSGTPSLAARGGRPEARLHGVVRTVLDTPTGQRNDAFFWAACRIGGMVAEGHIDEATAVAVLHDAGSHVGLTAHEMGDAHRGTIASGLRTGQRGGAQ